MLILNCAHPLTDEQRAHITALMGETPEVCDIPTHIDRSQPLAEVATALADAAGLSQQQWQTTLLLLNPPALAPVATALLAELHGRCGYFPPIINVRPVAGAVPPRYEIGEIVSLNDIREHARASR